MPPDVKQFIGRMNLDDPNETLGRGEHKYASNIRFIGERGNLRVQGALGNTLISNPSLPTGTNQTIGAFYDQVRKRIIFFNWNSNGKNGIYQYSVTNNTLSKLFVCFTDSATDILGFNRNSPIHSAVIVYRTTSDGDLLLWTDNLNRPRCINIDTVSAVAPFTQDMINAAKNAPLSPSTAIFQDNSTVNVNNLRKKLVRFSYRWVYKNLEKSTIAPISKVPLPINGYDPDVQTDPTLNNNIGVTVTAGGNDSKAIEILFQISNGSTWSDFYSAVTLDMAEYNISPLGTYTFNFFNNATYVPVDPIETGLPFSYVPDLAEAMELLNGNSLIYANLTDGYDRLTRSQVDVTITSAVASANTPTISWAQSGTGTITIYIGATVTPGVTYHVQFDYVSNAGGDASPKNVNYVAIGGDTPTSVAVALAALLNGQNIQADSLGSGALRVLTINGINGTITNTVTSVSGSAGSAQSAPAWNWLTQYVFGLVYFDDRGKTNGVISFMGASVDTTDFAVTTPAFTTSSNVVQVPYIASTINHTPPTWATSYQWVRVPTGYKFIQYITNDYQSDASSLYLCIQDLYYQNAQNTGFVPTYDFAVGDHVKIFASYSTGTGFYAPYNDQLDFEILGVVDRTMTSPAITGKFLKVAKPVSIPAYGAKMLIQIYTPPTINPLAEQQYFEWGEKYNIYATGGNRYHRGQIADQTASQPASFQWFDGDVYFKNRTLYVDVNATTTKNAFMIDPNYSDYYSSSVSSNGRSWIIDENARQIVNTVQLRWGKAYQQDTNINQLNIFYPDDFDTIDLSKGPIWRLKVRDRILRAFQDRGTGQMGIYAKFIQDSGGNNILTTTEDIITTNNIQYYEGEYGLGGYPTSLVSTESVDYFSDPVRGIQLRLSGDGFTEISTEAKGQYTIKSYLTPYNKTITRPDGTVAKIMGVYDYREDNYIPFLQGGNYGTTNYPSRTFSFNEPLNSYWSFYDWHPDFAISAEDVVYTFLNGQLWAHNNESKHGNFYGVQYYPSITAVFNGDIAVKKTFEAISYQANQYWQSDVTGDIITSQPNPQTGLPQVSQLKSVDYDIQEGLYYAAFLKDANSMSDARLALVEGDFLKGVWVQVKLTYKGSDFSYLYLPYIKWDVSPRNL